MHRPCRWLREGHLGKRPRSRLLEGQLRCRSLAEECQEHLPRRQLLEEQLEGQLRCWPPVEERWELRQRAESRGVCGGAKLNIWLAIVALGEIV